ncbi:S1 family peptidase [Streptomyces sp. NPDC005799]|uniref:S1 family peptidase n=1 Tax=Streptomyces sp. NPDC005799 TaxID=3154678 RepID=UPI0033D00518
MVSEQSRAVTQAAVASLRESLGLSDTEARRRFAAQPALDALGGRLVGQLKDRQAGAWIDPADGGLVVNVLDPGGARTVQAAGARARIVRHSSAQLQHIVSKLSGAGMPAGSSWGIDPRADAVVVEVPGGQPLTSLRRYGDAVISKRSAARTRSLAGPASAAAAAAAGTTDLYGGLVINADFPGGPRCTSGFVARPAHTYPGAFTYLLTAGHCGEVNSKWYRGNSIIGAISHRVWGPDDYATIALSNPDVWRPQPWVYTTSAQPVRGGYTPATVGVTVCMRGAISGYSCGQIDEFNTGFVDEISGVRVSGLVQADLCSAPGDSGAPVITSFRNGVLGVGMISGSPLTSAGQCQGVAMYEPLATVLKKADLDLVMAE